jgi:UDPglucose 6-dehydrogenase
VDDTHTLTHTLTHTQRVGGKYLRPGYGFGGPCFPRDNRALGQHIKNCGIEPLIPMATDNANKAHTKLQADDLLNSSKPGDAFVFSSIGYKENCSVPIIEESQKLYIAVVLAKAKRKVTLRDRGNLILAAQQAYGNLFEYEVIDMGLDEPLVQQPAQSAHSSRALASSDSYGVRRL